MPLTEKGEKILRSMKENYGSEKGERVFYSSKNAGTITGVDDMEEKPEDCGDHGIMAPMPAMSPIPTPALSPADGTFGGVVDAGFGRDQTLVMPPEPMPSTQHPQLHPDASAPPEPALGGRDAAAGYGGVAGGVIPQEFGDRGLGDALPTQVSHNDICRAGEQFWGPQWGGTE